MLKKVLVTLGLLFLLILSGKATETIVPRLSPLPATIQGQKISLNGEWYFHPSLKSGFNGTEDVKNWNTIQVPGEWVMQGFEVKKGEAAYHSGWGTVDNLLRMEEHSSDGQTLKGFPYNQMHHYVEKITAGYAAYTRLYGG